MQTSSHNLNDTFSSTGVFVTLHSSTRFICIRLSARQRSEGKGREERLLSRLESGSGSCRRVNNLLCLFSSRRIPSSDAGTVHAHNTFEIIDEYVIHPRGAHQIPPRFLTFSSHAFPPHPPSLPLPSFCMLMPSVIPSCRLCRP